MVTRMRLIVMLYIHCVSCLFAPSFLFGVLMFDLFLTLWYFVCLLVFLSLFLLLNECWPPFFGRDLISYGLVFF